MEGGAGGPPSIVPHLDGTGSTLCLCGTNVNAGNLAAIRGIHCDCSSLASQHYEPSARSSGMPTQDPLHDLWSRGARGRIWVTRRASTVWTRRPCRIGPAPPDG